MTQIMFLLKKETVHSLNGNENHGISTERNDFPYSVLPKKYRTVIPSLTKIPYVTVRYGIFFRVVIPYLSVLINLLNICSYAIANERFYNSIILFSPQKNGSLIQLVTVRRINIKRLK